MSETARLLTAFIPEHYELYFDIDRAEKRIKGKTTIVGVAKEKNISLNQKGLKVIHVESNGEKVAFDLDDKAEQVHLALPADGKTTIVITYETKLTDSMMGIYPSYYTVDGVKKQLVGTQFETTAARQAFPCVDEPSAKAIFSLAIKFDEHPGETVIANMPEARCENGIHYFEPTLKMSTYLIAFTFGELQGKYTKTKSNVEIGVFSTKAHDSKELDFALDIAKRSIEFFESYYQTPYPLPHSYQVALPDFSAGAMENWGLVTYREAYLLLDPDNTSLEMKQLVATVIAHELAHQWFGDLVTMAWWDDIWLNESFANMMEYVAVEALEPTWKIWETFQTSEVPAALQRDATDGVQSVHVQVDHPADIDSLFDSAIVYAKGARLLVMVRALIGDEALRKGLKYYFDQHQYGNAKGDDLWQALGQASGLDLGQVMHSWLDQPGYPVVSVQIKDGNLTLKQTQFFIGEGQEKGRKWQIPLRTNDQKSPKLMTEEKIALGDYQTLRDHAKAPFRLNVGNTSHFIVKYEPALLKDILSTSEQLDAITQLQLLQDLRLLAEGRQTPYHELVPLLIKFASSHFAIVNASLYRIANNLKRFVKPKSPEEKELKAFFNQLSREAFQRLGWKAKKDESNDDQLTRPYILSAALYGENQTAIAQAHDLFVSHRNDLQHLNAAIRLFVLRNEVIHNGTPKLIADLLQTYRTSSDAAYQADICAALTSSPDRAALTKLIDCFKDSETIKPQDLRSWYRNVLNNSAGEQLAWDWLRQNWGWLDETVGGDMEFTTYITVTAGAFHTPERLAEFKAFFLPKVEIPGLGREIQMDTKVITSRTELIQAEKDRVIKAISDCLPR